MKIPRQTFYAANPQKDMALVLYPSGTTLLCSSRIGQAFMTQFDAPGLDQLIEAHPRETRWQVQTRDVSPSLHAAIRDHRIITLQAGDNPPLVAFCQRRITRQTAEAILTEFPEITAVACSEGLILRNASRTQGKLSEAAILKPEKIA